MFLERMNASGEMTSPRLVFTYQDYQALPARMFDAIDFVAETKREMEEKYGRNREK